MKIEFSTQIVKLYPNIKFRENSSSGNRVIPCRQTGMKKDRSRFSKSC